MSKKLDPSRTRADKGGNSARSRDPEQVGAQSRPEHPMLGLQQTAGNRAVQRLVEGDSQAGGESSVIQRHLGPVAEGLASASSATMTATMGSAAAAVGLLESLRAAANSHPCTTAEEGPQVPATAGF